MILLTGGTGYIGSHMLLALLDAGYDVVVLDNLSNSSKASFDRVCQLVEQKGQGNGTKTSCPRAVFVKGDIRDAILLADIFNRYDIDSVLHFAGLKAVGESVNQPLKYFENNISGSLCLFEAMQAAKVSKLVFSSSATVYGNPKKLPITEQASLAMPTNPYGYTKLAIEQMLMQLAVADTSLKIAALRYFNPIGAHASGEIGEHPQGIPNNLMPYISQVAIGRLSKLAVFGDDYDTPDGTGVRDYIHVMDLVAGHLKALEYIDKQSGYHMWNLGTGQGYSVLQMIQAFERVTGQSIAYEIKPRREGDIASYYADATKARNELGWQAQYDLDAMMADTWRWQSKNPNGY